MQPTAVFAATPSRLHADLVVIRLKRAGIPRSNISAVFPQHSKPNCALCWLDGHSTPTLYSGKTLTVAGPMTEQLSMHSEPTLIRSLEQMGLTVDDACFYAECIKTGQILISVSTDDASEAVVAWQTFSQLETEGTVLGLSTRPEENQTRLRPLSPQRKELVASDGGSDLELAV